jgi:toxin ParE1/3/4
MQIIKRTTKAKSDLLEIWDYIADDNEKRADEFLLKIDQVINNLAQIPTIAKSRKELMEGLRSFPCGRYIIFFTVITGGIEIIRVLHSSRDINPNFFSDEDE